MKKPQHIILTPGAVKDLVGLNRYVGLTYPHFLNWKIWQQTIHKLWKKFLCPKHIHLFDETASIEHTLDCSACELRVHIALIETSEEACDRARKGLYVKTLAIEKSELDATHHIHIK